MQLPVHHSYEYKPKFKLVAYLLQLCLCWATNLCFRNKSLNRRSHCMSN